MRPRNRLSLIRLESRAVPATFAVTSTADTEEVGTLRRAILDANATPGADTIAFAIPGEGVVTIAPTTVLPAITEAVTIDGFTQVGAAFGRPLVEISGAAIPRYSWYTVSTATPYFGPPSPFDPSDSQTLPQLPLTPRLSDAQRSIGPPSFFDFDDGLKLGSVGSTVRGLVINGFAGAGVRIAGSDNTLAGNFIGTDATGTKPRPNNVGVSIGRLYDYSYTTQPGDLFGARDNVVGPAGDPTGANVISGNSGYGISFEFNSNGNRAETNYIGTDPTGKIAVGNVGGGVSMSGTGDTLGSLAFGAGNVISGNGDDGVFIQGSGNRVVGNFIGVSGDASAALPNGGHGVLLVGSDNTVAGRLLTPGSKQVIAGNLKSGVFAGGNNNAILGNLIGTTREGDRAIPNALDGVTVTGSRNIIGGTGASEGNLISGNGKAGVRLKAGAVSTDVLGNFIGTDATGTRGLGNGAPDDPDGGDGVRFDGGTRNTVSGNLISANSSDGVDLRGSSLLNTVSDNRIGTDASGTAALGNGEDGVYLEGATANTVRGNVIAGNGSNGVFLYGPGTDANSVVGNSIGTDATGTLAIPNAREGVFVWQDAPTNATGPTGNAVEGNTIAFNGGAGVRVGLTPDDGSGDTRIAGNTVRANAGGSVIVSDGTPTPDQPETPVRVSLTAAGSIAGTPPSVRVLNADGTLRHTFTPFESSYLGGVSTAVGDVTGDGVDDVLAFAGFTGGPRLRVYDGETGATLADFFAYESSYRNGVTAALADLDGDGTKEILATPGRRGGPVLAAFDATGASLGRALIGPADDRGGVAIRGLDAAPGPAGDSPTPNPILAADALLFSRTPDSTPVRVPAVEVAKWLRGEGDPRGTLAGLFVG